MIRLSGVPDDWKTSYQTARPWPHLILDSVVTSDVAGEVVAQATGTPSSVFCHGLSRRVRKDAAADSHSLGATVERLFEELADQPLPRFPDPGDRSGRPAGRRLAPQRGSLHHLAGRMAAGARRLPTSPGDPPVEPRRRPALLL